jgi:hypothetical protein
VRDKEVKKDSLLWERNDTVLLDVEQFYLSITQKNAVANATLIQIKLTRR